MISLSYCKIKLSPLALVIGLAIFAHGNIVLAGETFNPAFISSDIASVADLNRLAQGDAQPPGQYRVDIYLNNEFLNAKDILFSVGSADHQTAEESKKETGLVPCLTKDYIDTLPINMRLFPALSDIPDQECIPLTRVIPQSQIRFDFHQQRLYISIPQAALTNSARGYVPEEQWNEGVPALLLDYNFSGNNSRNTKLGTTYDNYYLRLNSGMNLGAWRLRNASSAIINHGNGDNTREWQNISTYLQRGINALKSTLVVGDTFTSGNIFDSIGVRGIRLYSDDNMLPESQRGFAPTVRGVANSNATVTVRQNGYVIYQSFVPPGPFIIDDLYQTSSSGDLDVSVEENNGGVTRFTIPYSAVPLLQREGRIKYSLTAGEFRSGSPQKNKPQFGEGSIIVGLGKNLTFFSGIQLANHYKAIAIGSGLNMGKWGAVSADITQANSILADDSHHHGQSMRFLYAKSLNDLGTRFQLIGYRYSTEGFYTLDETAYDRLSGYRWENENLEGKAPILVDSFNLNYAKKGKIQASISQQTGHFGSIYISGSRQTYWRTSKTSDYLQANFNWMLKNVNYSIGYSLARNPWIDNVDRIFSFNLSVPLAEWLTKDSGPGRGSNLNNTAYATYSVTHDSNGKTSQQAGVSGTLLEQNNLGYSVTQGYSNQGGGYGGSTALDWSAGYGRVNTGYNYSKEYRQFNYGVSGGVIVHSDGVTLSQSLGDTNVLIKAPGASDVGVDNTTGVTTDWRGYAVMPYASPYQRNRVALQTTTLKNNTELDDTVLNVVPTQGAVVVADFKVRQGIRGLFTLLKPDGKPVPLGAVVSVKGDNTSQGIVGDNGQIYLAGLGLSGLLNVVWGHMPSQQCEATYQLSPGSENQAIIRAQLGCQ